MYSFRMYVEKSYVFAVKKNGEYQGGMYINAENTTTSIRSTTINGEKSNEIKALNSQKEILSKDNKALNERLKSSESQVNKKR